MSALNSTLLFAFRDDHDSKEGAHMKISFSTCFLSVILCCAMVIISVYMSCESDMNDYMLKIWIYFFLFEFWIVQGRFNTGLNELIKLTSVELRSSNGACITCSTASKQFK